MINCNIYHLPHNIKRVSEQLNYSKVCKVCRLCTTWDIRKASRTWRERGCFSGMKVIEHLVHAKDASKPGWRSTDCMNNCSIQLTWLAWKCGSCLNSFESRIISMVDFSFLSKCQSSWTIFRRKGDMDMSYTLCISKIYMADGITMLTKQMILQMSVWFIYYFLLVY